MVNSKSTANLLALAVHLIFAPFLEDQSIELTREHRCCNAISSHLSFLIHGDRTEKGRYVRMAVRKNEGWEERGIIMTYKKEKIEWRRDFEKEKKEEN